MKSPQIALVLAFCLGLICGVVIWESRSFLISLTHLLAVIVVTPLYQSLMLTATAILTAMLLLYAILSTRRRK